jgi:hypothetical protein
MADKKYPGAEDGLQKLKAKIMESSGPVTHGVTVSLILIFINLVTYRKQI